jgi:N utilization substance protein A
VPDDQLSLAIGKEGQNARLAAKLTGWRIDIKSVSEAAEDVIRRQKERERRAAIEPKDLLAVAEAILLGKGLDELTGLPETLEDLNLGTRVINALKNNDVETPQQLIELTAAGDDALLTLAGIGPKATEAIKAALEATNLWPQPTEAEAKMEAPEEEEEVTPEEPVAEEEAIEELVAEQPTEIIEVAEALVDEILSTETPSVAESEIPVEEEEEPAPEEPLEEAEEAGLAVIDEEEPIDLFILEAWDEDEDEPGKTKRSKKKKKKHLEYDESLGQVVSRTKRKPGRRREDWEDYF